MRVKTRTVSGLTADPDGVANSQNMTAGAPLSLTGAAASMSPPRRLIFDADADISGIVFAIVGVDRFGNPIAETVTGVTTTPVTTQRIYASVTSITPDTTDAINAVFVGWGAEVISAPIVLDHFRNPFNAGLGVVVTGTVNYTVQHTFDDLELGDLSDYPRVGAGVSDGSGTWFDHETLAGETASGDGNYAFAVEAIRIVLNSGSGTVVLKAMQSGPRG